MKRLILLTLLLLAACAPASTPTNPSPTQDARTRSAMTATPVPATATPTATARPSLTLRFWLPDEMAGLESVDAGDVLSEQISGFERDNPLIEVELRLRAATGTGGVLATLQTAAIAAPGALPDITLLRYTDFQIAAQAGLLARLDAAALALNDDNWHSAVRALGNLEGRRYGIPFTLRLLHTAYNEDALTISSWRFDDLLAENIAWTFPAAPSDGLSSIFLLQYWLAGAGDVSTDSLAFDENALRAVLRYYERASAAELIPMDVLEYDTPERSASALSSDLPAVVTSSMALASLLNDQPISFGRIPSPTGEPATLLDGWLWVITTSDPQRQAAAMALLEYLLQPERQLAYHRAIAMLPAAISTQRQLDADYAAFIDTLMQTVIIARPEYVDGPIARALQSAFASVIGGQSTAADALQNVVTQLGG
jgi:ABC-type glycerol-3-phosphate transport system substrate-binding protein